MDIQAESLDEDIEEGSIEAELPQNAMRISNQFN